MSATLISDFCCPRCTVLGDSTTGTVEAADGTYEIVTCDAKSCGSKWKVHKESQTVLPIDARQCFPAKFPTGADRFPFSDALCAFMDANPGFTLSLKLVNPRKFVLIPFIINSHTLPTHPKNADEVIGLWYLNVIHASTRGQPLFKQDFIVNVGSQHEEYISYAAKDIVDTLKSPHVRPIDDFFEKDYGDNGAYCYNGSKWQQHYNTVADLPRELRSLGQKYLDKLKRLMPWKTS